MKISPAKNPANPRFLTISKILKNLADYYFLENNFSKKYTEKS